MSNEVIHKGDKGEGGESYTQQSSIVRLVCQHTFRPAACNLALEVQSKRFEGKVFFVVDNELSIDNGTLRACPGEHQPLDLLVIALTC